LYGIGLNGIGLYGIGLYDISRPLSGDPLAPGLPREYLLAHAALVALERHCDQAALVEVVFAGDPPDVVFQRPAAISAGSRDRFPRAQLYHEADSLHPLFGYCKRLRQGDKICGKVDHPDQPVDDDIDENIQQEPHNRHKHHQLDLQETRGVALLDEKLAHGDECVEHRVYHEDCGLLANYVSAKSPATGIPVKQTDEKELEKQPLVDLRSAHPRRKKQPTRKHHAHKERKMAEKQRRKHIEEVVDHMAGGRVGMIQQVCGANGKANARNVRKQVATKKSWTKFASGAQSRLRKRFSQRQQKKKNMRATKTEAARTKPATEGDAGNGREKAQKEIEDRDDEEQGRRSRTPSATTSMNLSYPKRRPRRDRRKGEKKEQSSLP
jgi:hypothetical protein